MVEYDPGPTAPEAGFVGRTVKQEPFSIGSTKNEKSLFLGIRPILLLRINIISLSRPLRAGYLPGVYKIQLNSDLPEPFLRWVETLRIYEIATPVAAVVCADFPPLLLAQNSASKPGRIITGNVKNEKGEFIVGASVYVKSTPRIGTATDAKGEFRLQGIPSGSQTIVFTFIGMIPFEVEYANQRDMQVVLKEDATQVNEVVVTGIYSRDKNSFAGSAKDLHGQGAAGHRNEERLSESQTLEPALTLVENRAFGSDPNRLPDLEIRGKTSLVGDLTTEYDNTANQPLFILDGIEVEIAQIQNLSMDRIGSVTVLKDAASAAIYGSKASNGVIVVETVKPEPGQLRISYTADLRFEFPDLSDYNLMNAGEKLRYEVLAGRYVGEDQDQLDALYNSRLAEVMRGVDTYWLSVPLRSVLNHSHSVYIDGGSEAMLYGVGLNYSDRKVS